MNSCKREAVGVGGRESANVWLWKEGKERKKEERPSYQVVRWDAGPAQVIFLGNDTLAWE